MHAYCISYITQGLNRGLLCGPNLPECNSYYIIFTILRSLKEEQHQMEEEKCYFHVLSDER